MARAAENQRFADRVSGRWSGLWATVTADEVGLLREVIAEAVKLIATKPYDRIADEANVNVYDIRNLLAGNSRPGHWPGLRMLRFAANLDQQGFILAPILDGKIKQIKGIVARLSIFEPDADYFFRHLQRENAPRAPTQPVPRRTTTGARHPRQRRLRPVQEPHLALHPGRIVGTQISH